MSKRSNNNDFLGGFLGGGKSGSGTGGLFGGNKLIALSVLGGNPGILNTVVSGNVIGELLGNSNLGTQMASAEMMRGMLNPCGQQQQACCTSQQQYIVQPQGHQGHQQHSGQQMIVPHQGQQFIMPPQNQMYIAPPQNQWPQGQQGHQYITSDTLSKIKNDFASMTRNIVEDEMSRQYKKFVEKNPHVFTPPQQQVQQPQQVVQPPQQQPQQPQQVVHPMQQQVQQPQQVVHPMQQHIAPYQPQEIVQQHNEQEIIPANINEQFTLMNTRFEMLMEQIAKVSAQQKIINESLVATQNHVRRLENHINTVEEAQEYPNREPGDDENNEKQHRHAPPQQQARGRVRQ